MLLMRCLGNMGFGRCCFTKIHEGNNALSTLLLFFSFVRGV